MKTLLKTTLLALSISLASVGNAQTDYQLGLIAAQQKNYTSALNHWKKAATKGNPSAMYSIGVMYYYGRGVPQNYQTAMDWYKKAINKGNASAMFNVGVMYYYGEGVPQNYGIAMGWYKKVAAKGDADAMYNIGVMYAEGQGVAQNYQTAMDWYKKAAAKGYTSAMYNIGVMYAEGQGVAQNYHTAMDWYKKAATKKDADAMNNIGLMYAKGNSVSQNYQIAMDWYKQAATKEDSDAMNNIGFSYEHGLGIRKNINTAAQWYAKSYQARINNGEDKHSENFRLTKKNLERLYTSNQITDSTIRKQVESIFAKSPLITWQSTPPSNTNKESISFSVKLTDQGAGIGNVRVLLDGVSVDQATIRGITRQLNQNSKSFNLIIPEGTHEITVDAMPAENIGIPNKVSTTITSTYKKVEKPKLHAVVVGINDYENPKLKLTYANDDAQAIYNTLNKQIGSIYDKGSMTLLNTKSTTSKSSIINQLNNIKAQVTMNDVFVFYVAGHGFNFPDAGYYLFTSDVGATSSSQVNKTGIDAEELQDLLASVKTNKKLILMDTCDSGGSISAEKLLGRGMDEQMVIDRINRKSGAAVIMASTDKQKALEGYQGHGLFTYGLLQALQGKADLDNNGYASTDELKMFAENKIPEIAQQAFNHKQFPTANTSGQGFEFKVVK